MTRHFKAILWILRATNININFTILLSLCFIFGCSTNSKSTSNDDKTSQVIYYTTYDESIMYPSKCDFNADIISNTYTNGIGIIRFNGSINYVGANAFEGCTRLTSITIMHLSLLFWKG